MRKLIASVLGVSCIQVIVTAFVRYGVQTILNLGGLHPLVSTIFILTFRL